VSCQAKCQAEVDVCKEYINMLQSSSLGHREALKKLRVEKNEEMNQAQVKWQAEMDACKAHMHTLECYNLHHKEALKNLRVEKNEEMHKELREEMDKAQAALLDWSAAEVQKSQAAAKTELESLRADKDNTISLLRASLRDVQERYKKKSKMHSEQKRLH
jgi:hypothetical protein